MKSIIVGVVIALLAGCSNMSTSQQRVTTGTLGGAGAGALISAMAGNAGMGAAIGAGAGLVGGVLYDHYKKSEESAYQNGYNQGVAASGSSSPGH
jgi:uncharacterized membrane protein